jgi:hypothetical protein
MNAQGVITLFACPDRRMASKEFRKNVIVGIALANAAVWTQVTARRHVIKIKTYLAGWPIQA